MKRKFQSDDDSASERLHIETRNSITGMHIARAYQAHYSRQVREIERDPVAASESDAQKKQANENRLPPPIKIEHGVSEVINARASSREFGKEPLDLEKFATLLYLANGTHHSTGTIRRTVPSSGGLWSTEVFAIVMNVEDLAPGVYHYHSASHRILPVRLGHFAGWLRHRGLYQPEFSTASVLFVLACCFGRIKYKYGERAYRLGYIDAGHVSSNLYLSATGLGLPVCATAGFVDDEFDAMLEFDGLDWSTVLTVAVGTGT